MGGGGLRAEQRPEVTADVPALERSGSATRAPGYLCAPEQTRAFIIILGTSDRGPLFICKWRTHARTRAFAHVANEAETLVGGVANSRHTLIYREHEMTPLKLFVALER